MPAPSSPDPQLQIALLTGQSAPGSCALSPVQAQFLARLQAAGGGAWRAIGLNFPYDSATPPHRTPSLLTASLANASQYLGSRHPAFAARHRPAMLRLIAQAPRTVWLTGSCGLELLANLALPAEALARCRVLAYGPAARRVPDIRTELVIGRRDWVSALLFRPPPGLRVHRLDCDHLNYLPHPDMAAITLDFLRRAAHEPDAAAAQRT